MSTKAYNDLPRLRWTLLKSILHSELNFLQTLANPVKQTGAMRKGSTGHVAVLEPAIYAESAVLIPEEFVSDTTGDILANKNVKAWLASIDPDALLVTEVQHAMFAATVERIAAHEDAGVWLAESPSEFREGELFWTETIAVEGAIAGPSPFPWARILDGAVELDCKATYDAFCPRLNLLVELKFDFKPDFTVRRCKARIWADRWSGQLGMYSRALLANGIVTEPPSMAVIVVSGRPGFEDVIAYEFETAEACDEARDEALQALTKLAAAIAFDRWPGVAPQKVIVDVPDWRRANSEDAADLGLDGLEGDEDGE